MKKNAKLFVSLLLKLINYCIGVNRNTIYFIPHPNCRKDLYDIVNYSSDNVLSFFHYCLYSGKLNNKKIYIQIYDLKKKKYYIEYVRKYSIDLNIEFILSDYFVFEDYNYFKALNFWFVHFKSFCKSSYVFTSAYWYNFSYKKHSQKVICLNYFTPFKKDYYFRSFDRSFDYCLTTSDLFAHVDSLASGISYHKYLPLGFSRNDNLLTPRMSLNSINHLFEKVPYNVAKVLLYTPTYRDYDVDNTQKRNIFGYSNNLDESFSALLQENAAVLLVKLHPLQSMDVFFPINSSSIILLSPSENYNLYDLLSISSLLITDYTSTYFDYLLLNRPVIFNFYDVERYNSMRGFSFDPIESVCIGKIIYSYELLLYSILDCFNDKLTSNERSKLLPLFHKFTDSNTSERIYNYFFHQINK